MLFELRSICVAAGVCRVPQPGLGATANLHMHRGRHDIRLTTSFTPAGTSTKQRSSSSTTATVTVVSSRTRVPDPPSPLTTSVVGTETANNIVSANELSSATPLPPSAVALPVATPASNSSSSRRARNVIPILNPADYDRELHAEGARLVVVRVEGSQGPALKRNPWAGSTPVTFGAEDPFKTPESMKALAAQLGPFTDRCAADCPPDVRFLSLKADTPPAKALCRQLGVPAVPCVLMFDSATGRKLWEGKGVSIQQDLQAGKQQLLKLNQPLPVMLSRT
jgi:hypothetical protein